VICGCAALEIFGGALDAQDALVDLQSQLDDKILVDVSGFVDFLGKGQ